MPLAFNPDLPGSFLPSGYSAGGETTPLIRRYHLTDGYSDAEQIVAALADFTRAYGANPEVRSFAEKLLPADMRHNDQAAHYKAVIGFMRSHMKYVADPRGIEYVVSPLQHIHTIQKQGYSVGDCDDQVLLFNTLLTSLGIETKTAAVRVNGSKVFNHVISMAKIAGSWIDYDLCTPDPFTDHPGERLVAP